MVEVIFNEPNQVPKLFSYFFLLMLPNSVRVDDFEYFAFFEVDEKLAILLINKLRSGYGDHRSLFGAIPPLVVKYVCIDTRQLISVHFPVIVKNKLF